MSVRAIAAPAPTATPATAPATSPATTASTRLVSLPSFGLKLSLPAGYARDVDTEKSAIMIAPADRVGRAQERAIMVNVTPARGQRLERAVEDALKTSGGMKVVRADAQWGGLKATELALPAEAGKPDKPRTLRSLMLEREDYLYLLGLVGTGDEADRRAFDEVAAGTTWQKIARASEGVAGREPPLALPIGGFTFTLPDPFRPEASRAKNVAVFVARDLPTRVVAARLTITILPPPSAAKDGTGAAPPAARTLADLKAEVERTFAPQWRVREPLQWSNVVGREVQGSVSRPVQTPDGWAQGLVIITADGRRATVFGLQCRGLLADAGPFEQVLRTIRASIAPLQK